MRALPRRAARGLPAASGATRRRHLASGALTAVLTLGLVGCPGLLVAPGNDFPCDFSLPPGSRDAVCSAGDVCGVDNRCRRFRYEGPQFEGKPTFPSFADGGAVLHPTLITGAVQFITRTPRTSVAGPMGPLTREPLLVLRTSEGSFVGTGVDIRPIPVSTELVEPVAVREAVTLALVGRTPAGRLAVQRFPGPMRPDPLLTGPTVTRLRAFEVDGEALVVSLGSETGEVTLEPQLGFRRWALDAGVFDVAPGPQVSPRLRAGVTLLTENGLAFRFRDGGVEPVGERFAVDQGGILGADATGSVYAVVRQQGQDVGTMAVFQVLRTGTAFEVRVPWNECTPCLERGPIQRGVRPFALTPGQDGEGVFVDVLCPDGLVRVRGAQGIAARDECEGDARPLPFDFARLGRRRVGALDVAQQDLASPIGFLGGGTQGQVWAGETLSTAAPLYLDRAPLDVERLSVELLDGGVGTALVAIAGPGLFARPDDAALATLTNGFSRVVLPQLGDKRVVGLVHESSGWIVLSSGDLFFARPSLRAGPLMREVAGVGFGPRLVDGRGDPVSRVLRGEAVTSADGGLVSMLVAADDSLYFIPAPATSALPGNQGQVTPQVTPEPSALIRSLALERTPIGTDGVTKMRGYVVTSRNVYEFKLGGAPLQWTTTPLRLSGSEPVEVWFDNPRGGLARAGYRDGTIFTIPGGFQLTEPLPSTDAGVAATVLDYENLGGWPVALTSVGLFVARYDATSDGRLDSRFPDGGLNKPMTWREVTLPDGSRPWLARQVEGRLQVLAEREERDDTTGVYKRLFRLLVFLPDRVLEVGQHERTNRSALAP